MVSEVTLSPRSGVLSTPLKKDERMAAVVERAIQEASFTSLYRFCKEHRLWNIVDVEGSLFVFECNDEGEWGLSRKSVPEAVCDACQPTAEVSARRFKLDDVLAHEDFASYCDPLIERALALDSDGVPKIFGFGLAQIGQVLQAASRRKIDLTKIVDPVTGRNIFTHLANIDKLEIHETIVKLARAFPETFLNVGQNVITILLRKRTCSRIGMAAVMDEYMKLGGQLDPLRTIWCQIVRKTRPDETFSKTFASLSADEQQILCEEAFYWENPFVYEVPAHPVKPCEYSINLMWLNKNKLSEYHDFVMDDRFFHETFAVPVARWAKASPGTRINIWIDGASTTKPGAAERSREAILKHLSGCEHGDIQFRDFRKLEVVQKNPQIFSKDTHIYFQVDLGRAIAADHILRNKECQFFVYGDLDMEPLTCRQLFDKRTVNYLDDLGFVMAKGGMMGYENGFQILNGAHEKMMDSHRTVIIDLSVDQANRLPFSLSEQQIYPTYNLMLGHLLHADGRYGRIIPSVGKTMSIDLFRYLNSCGQWSFTFEKDFPLPRYIMPVKPVLLPKSHFGP